MILFWFSILYIGEVILSQTLTWSGGWAGGHFNGTEAEIYSVSNPKGGVLTSFWITGLNKTWIDNAIVSYYIDGEQIPSIQFQVNMACGTGFVDYITPNWTEMNSGWGNEYIGKGSGVGGWYNTIKVPFNKSFRATIRSYLDCVSTSYSIFSGIDLYGYNITNNGEFNGLTLDECKQKCEQNNQCKYYTFYTNKNPTKCLLKTSSKGMIPSIPTVYSGDLDKHFCKESEYKPKHPGFYGVVRGIYGRDRMTINIGDIQIPSNAKAISQYNATLLNPLDYYDLFNINDVNEGILVMDTLGVTTGDYAYSIEGCVHWYSPINIPFNQSELIATGTADYFYSAFDFIGVYPEHLALSGYTWEESFNATTSDPYGPFTNTVYKWSAYRIHSRDYMMFQNSGRLSWRNGNAKPPPGGPDKCHREGYGNSSSGNATVTWVRSLAFLYVW